MHLEIKVQTTKEGKFIVECPRIPGCISEGTTLEEALDKLSDILSKNLSKRIKKDLKKLVQNIKNNPPDKNPKGIPQTNNLIFSNFPVSLN